MEWQHSEHAGDAMNNQPPINLFHLTFVFNYQTDSDKASKRSRNYQHPGRVKRFWRQWIGDEGPDGKRVSRLEGVPVVACRSTDFYELYKAWCQRSGVDKPVAKRILLANIGKRADCEKKIERYYSESGSIKQGTFITPACAPPIEAGIDKRKWHTACANMFIEGAKAWKGSCRGE